MNERGEKSHQIWIRSGEHVWTISDTRIEYAGIVANWRTLSAGPTTAEASDYRTGDYRRPRHGRNYLVRAISNKTDALHFHRLHSIVHQPRYAAIVSSNIRWTKRNICTQFQVFTYPFPQNRHIGDCVAGWIEQLPFWYCVRGPFHRIH